MNTITFILAIIGGVAAIYGIKGYFKDHVHKPNEEKQQLLLQFKMNQTLAKELHRSLTEFADVKYPPDQLRLL